MTENPSTEQTRWQRNAMEEFIVSENSKLGLVVQPEAVRQSVPHMIRDEPLYVIRDEPLSSSATSCDQSLMRFGVRPVCEHPGDQDRHEDIASILTNYFSRSYSSLR